MACFHLGTEIYSYYRCYVQQCDIIDHLKKHDPTKKYRRPNFPEIVSEYIAYLIRSQYDKTCTRYVKSGDLNSKGKKLEIKCFASNGPISFGPTEAWDVMYLIDARKQPTIEILVFENSNTSLEWQTIMINKKETFGTQSGAGRRPRISPESLISQIKLKNIGTFNIDDLLKGDTDIIKTMRDTKIADFFCGVGGIRLGFELADKKYKCVFSNEIDKKAITTYETNFEGKVNMTPIENLNPDDIPDFDIFLGGFPCQSFSVAGNRKGFDDNRGQLFFDIVRILKAKKPRAFLLENVKNLKTHDGGNTYKTIKKHLCRLGYSFKMKVMNTAKYANCPQNRERVFLVGFLDRDKCERFTFPNPIRSTKNISDFLQSEVDGKYYYTDDSKIYPKLVDSVTVPVDNNQVYQYRRHFVRANCSGQCPTLTANMGCGGHNVPIILDDNGIRKLTPRECFNLQTFPRKFKLPEIADSHLYKQAGNSVSVKLIKRIAVCIMDVL